MNNPQDGDAPIVEVLEFLVSPRGLQVIMDIQKLATILAVSVPSALAAAMIAPSEVQSLAKMALLVLNAGIADGSLVFVNGGVVSKEWANDPRHALNGDGTFKN